MPNQVVKRCNCGAHFTLAEWKKLELLKKNSGKMRAHDGEMFELRHCNSCGSTLARSTSAHKRPTPQPTASITRHPSAPSLPEAAAMLRVQGGSK